MEMFLLKVIVPSSSHTGRDSPCDTTEGVMITKKRSEDSEKWAAGGMQAVGGGKEDFPKWVTDKTDAFSYCSFVPCPSCHCWTLFLVALLPRRCRRPQDMLCSNCGVGMVILRCLGFFKSIAGCAYIAKSTSLDLSEGRSTPHFSKYNGKM